jgi:tRNA (guanine-N(7)-)-methyltransferase
MNVQKNIPSFVKRSRLTHQYQRDLIQNELQNFSIYNEAASDLINQNSSLNIALEIGFGDGQHILKKALLNPYTLFIGCEVYLNGIASLLKGITENGISNILIYNGDARDLCNALPNNLFNEIYILFPDPWPKTKHHKRRLINSDFIALLQVKRKNNSRIVIATDHVDYARWIDTALCDNHIQYSNIKPEDWIETKYQKKSEKLNIQTNYFVS